MSAKNDGESIGVSAVLLKQSYPAIALSLTPLNIAGRAVTRVSYRAYLAISTNLLA